VASDSLHDGLLLHYCITAPVRAAAESDPTQMGNGTAELKRAVLKDIYWKQVSVNALDKSLLSLVMAPLNTNSVCNN